MDLNWRLALMIGSSSRNLESFRSSMRPRANVPKLRSCLTLRTISRNNVRNDLKQSSRFIKKSWYISARIYKTPKHLTIVTKLLQMNIYFHYGANFLYKLYITLWTNISNNGWTLEEKKPRKNIGNEKNPYKKANKMATPFEWPSWPILKSHMSFQ